MKLKLEIVIIVLALIFGWHVSVWEGIDNATWHINPITDVATLRLPGAAASGITDPQAVAGFNFGRMTTAVPVGEMKLNTYARAHMDLYAMAIPYKVEVVDQK